MASFKKSDILIDGIRVQVLEAGRGEPLVYFHGAGTRSGFEELLPLSESRRLIVPVHPGYGGSDDDLKIDSILDYVVHYATLFDHLGLDKPVDLVGHSLGGWIATMFTILQGHRVRRLALACPAGLRVPGNATSDLFMIPPEQQLAYLVGSPELLAKMAAVPATNEMKIGRYREMTSLARVIWERNYDPKFDRWLKHIKAPTLILWGELDRAIPVAQAANWANHLANAEVATFKGVGHLIFSEAVDATKRLASFLDRDVQDLRKVAS